MASRSWNRVELIGNLTRDIEIRYTPSGAAVATFTIATNRTYVSDGERKEEADFHRCVAWNKLAELCSQLLKKGNRVFVSGRLQNRSWEGQDGQSRQVTEIVIEDMIVLSSRNGGETDSSEDYSKASDVEDVPTRVEPAPKKVEKASADVVEAEPAPKEEKEEVKSEELDDLPF